MFYYGCLSKACRFWFFKELPGSLAYSIIYLMLRTSALAPKWAIYAVKPACKHNAGNWDGKYLLNYRNSNSLFELVKVFLPETLITIDQSD
jgi:hypothetical protein